MDGTALQVLVHMKTWRRNIQAQVQVPSDVFKWRMHWPGAYQGEEPDSLEEAIAGPRH